MIIEKTIKKKEKGVRKSLQKVEILVLFPTSAEILAITAKALQEI